MLLFKNAGPATHAHLSPDERKRLAQQWNDWFDRLAREGKASHGQPLEAEGRVVLSVGGRVMDGPYAESKEAVGGYFFLTVADLAEATAIAKQCPSLELGITVEVRPLAAISPTLSDVHGRPPKG